jgi:hypothetical protein
VVDWKRKTRDVQGDLYALLRQDLCARDPERLSHLKKVGKTDHKPSVFLMFCSQKLYGGFVLGVVY